MDKDRQLKPVLMIRQTDFIRMMREALGISKTTARNWIKDGRTPKAVTTITRQAIFYKRAEVNAWLASHQGGGK